jgi:MoxR-like ATPase
MVFPYVDEKYAKEMLLRPELTDGSCYGLIKGQLTLEELLEIRDFIKNNVHVSAAFVDYLYQIVDCTRPGQKYFEKLVAEHPSVAPIMNMIKRGEQWGGGAGPRAEQCLVMAAKIYAFLYGVDEHNRPRHDYVDPSDLDSLLNPVLRARIILSPEAKWPDPELQDHPVTTDQVINIIKSKVEPIRDRAAFKRK